MLIDLVFEAGEALSVSAGLTLQHDGAAVRHDQPRPDQEYTVLAEGDLAVIGADELRALRDQQEPAARAVIDVLGHLRGDLARKIGTNAGDECSRNYCPGLDHVAGNGIFQAIRADGLAINRAVEEGRLAVLHVEKRLRIERRCICLSGWCRCLLVRRRNRRGRGSLPRTGGGEQMAGARSLGFLRDALLFGVDGSRARYLRAEHRPAEIARQGRTERRYSGRGKVVLGNAGIIARQGGEPFRRGFRFGVVELRPTARLPVPLIERPNQCATDGDGRDARKTRQYLAGEPHHWRSFTTQAQFGNGFVALSGLSLFRFVHHASLPSVRTMRTRRSEPLSPSRSSAAANRRSTIM